jgi:hypothetical protein
MKISEWGILVYLARAPVSVTGLAAVSITKGMGAYQNSDAWALGRVFLRWPADSSFCSYVRFIRRLGRCGGTLVVSVFTCPSPVVGADVATKASRAVVPGSGTIRQGSAPYASPRGGASTHDGGGCGRMDARRDSQPATLRE